MKNFIVVGTLNHKIIAEAISQNSEAASVEHFKASHPKCDVLSCTPSSDIDSKATRFYGASQDSHSYYATAYIDHDQHVKCQFSLTKSTAGALRLTLLSNPHISMRNVMSSCPIAM
jgi:lipid A disaccharide synthetase